MKHFSEEIVWLWILPQINLIAPNINLPDIFTKKGLQTAPQPLKIWSCATTGLLDNRLGRGLGYEKTSGDVIITWLWRHQYEENFTKKWKKVDFLKPIFRPEGSVLG